jgi:ribonuclease HII
MKLSRRDVLRFASQTVRPKNHLCKVFILDFSIFGMLVLGIDDAGRGPLIGPMILAGVLIEKNREEYLKKQGVKDSKQVEHPTRVKLAKMIKEISERFEVVKAFPNDIDFAITHGTNLNTLEAMKTAEIINEINTGKFLKEKITVVVDCPSVNISAWTKTLEGFVKKKDNLKIICEHKADVNHPVVSAASILAKVAREEEVAKIKKQFGETGSGYPADPVTKEFLKKEGERLKNSGIFRKSWATWKEIFPEEGQKTLGEF